MGFTHCIVLRRTDISSKVLEDLIAPLLSAVAKEKRDKSPLKHYLPPRPPTRRGRSGNGADSSLDSLAGLRPQAVLMRARLRHVALPGT